MKDTIKRLVEVDFDKENDPPADKTDGILAIAVLIFCIAVFHAFALLIYRTNFTGWVSAYIKNGYVMRIIVNFVLAIVLLVPIYAILRIRKQPLVSIGITKKNTLKSIMYGALYALPVVISRIIIYISKGYKLESPTNILLIFIYYFVNIALVEEIYFRGYIFTRIKYFISRKWLRIIIVSLLFCLMHLPMLLSGGTTILEFLIHNVWSLTLFGVFTILLYSETNNLLAPIVFHTVFNMVNSIFIVG